MKLPDPPKRAIRFLEWYCPPSLAEGILGDLYEEFDQDVIEKSEKYARRRFTWNVIRFFRPGILLRNNINRNKFTYNMWSNYLKIAGRNLAKRKMYSFINAVGLSIGIAFCMLIFLFIQDEQNFDKFHTNKESIYRVEEKAYDTWDQDPSEPYVYSAWLQAGLRDALLEESPQVEYATRFNDGGEAAIQYNNEVYSEDITFIDQDFFEIFSFKSLAGDRDRFLEDKYNVVLPVEIAERIFGDEDPLNKTLTVSIFGENQQMTVSGIIEDAPSNSSLAYGILTSQVNRPFFTQNLERWNNFNTPLFIQLNEYSQPEDVNPGLEAIIEKHMGSNLEEQRLEYSIPEDITIFSYDLTNIQDIHLDTKISWTRSSDPTYAYILGGLGLLILLIACINYISLALTSSAGRRAEVGIRKAIGAHRGQLMTQFSIEALLLALISLLLACGLVSLFLPKFNEFTSKDIVMDGPTILTMVGTGLLVSLLIGLISGSYPSIYLSRLNPTIVLKKLTGQVKAGFTRPLVVLQYALSGMLIICSIIMLRQMDFLATKELGYNEEQVLVIDTDGPISQKANRFIEQFRLQVDQYPQIESVGGTTLSFNKGWSRNGYTIDGEQKTAYVYGVDEHYIPTLGINLLEGRNFNATDSNKVIVNEALVRDMGWEDPLNEYLNWQEDSLSQGSKVIGVVKDYHFLSLEQDIEPMFLQNKNDRYIYLNSLLVRVAEGKIPETMDILTREWKMLAPDKPFNYTFLDEDVAAQYEQYERWTNIMTLSTLFAILISCLGLFGLAGINAVNRTKEIGIRKVMGAEFWHIFVLMNRQFIFLALISFVIAAPISWWLMTRWLESFRYAIEINMDVFVLSIGTGLVIAILTVSYHAIRATLINPADTLKYE